MRAFQAKCATDRAMVRAALQAALDPGDDMV